MTTNVIQVIGLDTVTGQQVIVPITEAVQFGQDIKLDLSTIGLCMTSPNSTVWRVTVDNSGVLTTTEVV